MASLMARFAAAGFQPIEHDGKLVHPMYRRPIVLGEVVRISFVSAGSPRVQGVSLRLRIPGTTGRRGEGGLLRVEKAAGPAVALWMDTSPTVVEAECVKLHDGAELQISNRWRLPNGREDEWLNNFGMLVELDERAAILRCSDGYGDEPSFDDLVVKVEVIKPR